MPTIRRLPAHLANQIAAGEVVERPASVVKELVENALDAGATSIEIRLLAGGKQLIEIRDNGVGMSRHDLEMSVEPHCTSKIGRAEDLSCITTLGFRGEALSSIGAVSRLSISSCKKNEEEGWMVQVAFGKNKVLKPHPCAPGTVVRVEDLFLRLPARSKFLKSDQAEYTRCLKMVQLFTAAWPKVEFRLKRGDRQTLLARPEDSLIERISPLLGKKVCEALINVKANARGLNLFGYVASPKDVRLSSRHLYFFLNRRPVTSPVMWRATLDAMKGFIVKGNNPAGAIFIDIDPELVDINVHPTKNEVRFERPNDIYRLIFHALRNALEKDSSTATVTAVASLGEKGQALVSDEQDVGQRHTIPLPWEKQRSSEKFEVQEPRFSEEETEEVGEKAFSSYSKGNFDHQPFDIVGQFHDSYILFQLGDELCILDQHAAHEALIFKRLMNEFDGQDILKQPLLVPHVVDIDREMMENFPFAKQLFDKLGLDADPFGDSQIIVRSLPKILSKDRGNLRLIDEVVVFLMENPETSQSELLRGVLSRIACSMAVKAGKRLNVMEMASLVKDCMKERVSNCPHGRPVMIKMGLEDLQKRFFRK